MVYAVSKAFALNLSAVPSYGVPVDRPPLLSGLVDGQMVPPSTGCGQSLLVPHQREWREVAQLRLSVLDAAALLPQSQERLTQPPVSSRLSDTGGPGGLFINRKETESDNGL